MAYETKASIKMMHDWKKSKRYKKLMFAIWIIKNKRLIQSFKDQLNK